MKKKTVAAVSAAVLTAGLGIGVSQLASAETPTPTPTTSPTSGTQKEAPGRKGGGHRHQEKLDLSGLASKLGVDQTELSEAVSAARKATEPAKPTERTKPSEQSQADREAARTARQEAFAKALATELGIDEATVTAVLNELRAEQEAERAAAGKAVLDQAVKDGKLTQAEADAVQKAADQGIVRIGGRGR